MTLSIRTKLLGMCVVLVLLTTAGLSLTCYNITKEGKHRESLERLHVAFDTILDDFSKRREQYIRSVEKFLQEDKAIRPAISSYQEDCQQRSTATHLAKAAGELEKFGRRQVVAKIALYEETSRLLTVYQAGEEQNALGIYVTTQERFRI